MKRQELLKAVLSATLVVVLCVGAGLAQGPPQPPGSYSGEEQMQGVPPQPGPPSDEEQAQGQAQGQAQDPPGRVARMQYVSGQVSIQPGGVNDWIEAAQNRPLTSADRVWTDKESRSELSLGTASIRMNSETSLTLSNVSDDSVQLQLDQGTLSVTVSRIFNGEVYEVDTPNIAFTIMKAGEYRFDVLPDADQTWVTVRKGQGQATGQREPVRVNDGERVKFTGGASLNHTAESAPARDAFEDWVKVRNEREGNSVSARYVAPGVIGYQDLDTYGEWRVAPEYGNVWYPYAAAIGPGWAPYRFGHWAWIEPWGWTWVDDAVWGFAPYHYGRWVWWGGAWGWCPGPVGYVRPIYAPALVAWFGGPRFGVGLSFGLGLGVGWFPLGWGEPFVPWYHVGFGYFRAVNITNTRITNVTVINNIYRNPAQVSSISYANRGVAGAVTATSNASFVAGHNMATAGVAVPASALQRGEVMRTAQIAPVRASVLGGHTPLTNGVPPARAFPRSVVTNQTPPTRPVSFEAKQAALSRNNGMPLDHATLNNLRTQQMETRGQTGAGTNPNTGSGAANTGRSTRTVPRPPEVGSGGAAASGSVTGNTVPRPPTNPTAPGGKNSPAPELKRAPTTPPREPNPKQEHQGESRGKGSAAVPQPPANYAYRPATPSVQTSAGSGGSYGRSSGTAGDSSSYGNRVNAPAESVPARSGGQSSHGSSGGYAGGLRG